jgi:hypothetical protein
MIFGLIRRTAPSLTASYKSERDRIRPWVTNLSPRLIQVEQHDHARLGIESEKGSQTNPDCDAHVVMQHLQPPKEHDGEVGPESNGPETERHRLTRYLDSCTTI